MLGPKIQQMNLQLEGQSVEGDGNKAKFTKITMRKLPLKLILLILKIILKIKDPKGRRKDPINRIEDHELTIDDSTINKLKDYSNTPKFVNISGVGLDDERGRLNNILNSLIKDLINGIKVNPSKLWVMQQFQIALIDIQDEDTEAREGFGTELENIMNILQIKSSDHLLAYYLG